MTAVPPTAAHRRIRHPQGGRDRHPRDLPDDPADADWVLVAERSSRRDEVVKDTVSRTGRAQTVGGVVLDLPDEALERQPTARR